MENKKAVFPVASLGASFSIATTFEYSKRLND